MKPNLGRDYIIRQAYEFEGPVIQDLYQDTLVALLDWDAPLDASWVLAVGPHKAEYYAAISLVARSTEPSPTRALSSAPPRRMPSA